MYYYLDRPSPTTAVPSTARCSGGDQYPRMAAMAAVGWRQKSTSLARRVPPHLVVPIQRLEIVFNWKRAIQRWCASFVFAFVHPSSDLISPPVNANAISGARGAQPTCTKKPRMKPTPRGNMSTGVGFPNFSATH